MATKITTRQIVQDIADELEMTQRDVRAVVDMLFEITAEELSAGNQVVFTNYVKFAHRYIAGKKKGAIVRNPFDGTTRKLDAATPAKLRISARALTRLQRSAPSPSTKAGKAAIAK